MFNKYSFNLCLCLLDAPWTPGQNSDRDLVTLPKHAPGTRAAMRQLWQPGSGRGRGGGSLTSALAPGVQVPFRWEKSDSSRAVIRS